MAEIGKTNELNEFLETIINKIGRQEWASRAYLNPLRDLKRGFITHANEIEDIYIARINGLTQDKTGVDTLKRVKPVVKSKYHKQNFEKCYTVSLSDKQVRQAFTSENGVKKLSDTILSQQHTGVEYDEYLAMKTALEGFATSLPATAKRTVVDVTNNTTAKDFVKAVKKDIAKMTFRSTNYCEYEQHTPIQDLVLFVNVDYQAEIDVELLASAFNISKAEINSKVIFVDGFTNANLKAVLCDKNALMVFDTLYNNEAQRNAKGMFTNYHLNVEKIVTYSNLYNGASYSIE